MKKLLQTKFVVIALFVAAPALAAGTAAAVGSTGDDDGPDAVLPADVQLAADREDDVAEAEDPAEQRAKPKKHPRSESAQSEEEENDQADDGDENEVDQPEANDNDDENEDDEDEGEQDDDDNEHESEGEEDGDDGGGDDD